jgi:hypothetical protein
MVPEPLSAAVAHALAAWVLVAELQALTAAAAAAAAAKQKQQQQQQQQQQ